ncbi:RNA polymerase sigma factor [Saccharopolyspora pogona]|uniref:RNA polymerase sigma factor n=1 Tax=Saccharopolyspora pogona TaxID=333966 RepID=UPI001CC24738|nr:sigma factor-like helix-turn-helix DNA-binding protein [Saccharopolyspora pogona]
MAGREPPYVAARGTARRLVARLGDITADPAEAELRLWNRDLVLCALSEVPPKQPTVLVLRYREVAAALGCAEGTVKSQASHGLENLRAAIAKTDPDLAGPSARRSE